MDVPIYFGPGIHELGEGLEVRSGQTIHLAGGAYVKGRIFGRDVRDARICGRGVLSGEGYPRDPDDPHKNMPDHLLPVRGWDSNSITVEGVTLVASPHYNILLEGTRHAVRNVKLISWWFGTDGVGIGNDSVVEDCFFKVNDDALKLYHSGMTVRNCVIWQMENGAPFQISWNMPGVNEGFTVSDCDVIRVEHEWHNDNEAVFNSIHGGSGHMRDYTFENIRIENAGWRLMNLLIKPNEFAPADVRPGRISGLTFRDIRADEPFALPATIRGAGPAGAIENVTFENLVIGNRAITNANAGSFEIDPESTKNIRFIGGSADETRSGK